MYKDKAEICHKCRGTDITIPPSDLDLKMTFSDYCRNVGNYVIFPVIDIRD